MRFQIRFNCIILTTVLITLAASIYQTFKLQTTKLEIMKMYEDSRCCGIRKLLRYLQLKLQYMCTYCTVIFILLILMAALLCLMSHVFRSEDSCRKPPQPQNGRWNIHPDWLKENNSGMKMRSGTSLIYSCNSGYKIKGLTNNIVLCLWGEWFTIPDCIAIGCKVLTTVSTEVRCMHDDKWISCETVLPGTKAILYCQNGYRPEINLLSAQGNIITCIANGQWEPKPMRCVPACGTLPSDMKPTIVGGVRPNVTEFPWHASLYHDKSGKTKEYFCGASLITENLLITAAHCVFDENTKQLIDASKIYVLMGNLFRDYNSIFHNQNFVKQNQGKHIYTKRNYLGLDGHYLWDIAILELVRPFVLTTWLVPVCMYTISDKNTTEVGSYGKIAGFGRTAHGESSAILQALTVPIISFSQCLSETQRANTLQYVNDKFCAGYKNGSSVCDGDSGSGLVFKTNGLWYLRGIVSCSVDTIQDGGTARCNNYSYTLYTNVPEHLLWIQEVISKIKQNQRQALCSNESYTRCF